MARAKRHHYVPQMHLRQFGVRLEADRIWRYDKRTEAILSLPIKDAAVIGNYYTVTTEKGPDDGLEVIFSKVEAAAAPVIRRLCAEPGPRFDVDPLDRYVLGLYLALQHGRVPATRLAYTQIAEFGRSIELDMRLADREGYILALRELGATEPDEALDRQRQEGLEALRSGELRVRASESASLDMTVISMQTISPLIAAMGWWLLKRSSLPGYVIGDAPVSVWASSTHPMFRGAGFATPDAEVSVPLDAGTMLVMGHNMPDGYLFHEERIPPPSVLHWQAPWPYHYRQWSRAERYVFAQHRVDLEAIATMLEEDARRRPGGGIEVVSHGPKEWAGYVPRRRSR